MFRKQKENQIKGIPSSLLFNQSILDVFVLQGILELEDASRLKKHLKTNREIESFLLKNHLVTKDTINKAYSIILKLPFIELVNIEIPAEALDLIPEGVAKKLGIIPFSLEGKMIKIAVTQPADLPLGFANAVKKLFKNKQVSIELFVTGTEDYKEALKQYKNKKRKNLLIKKGSLPVIYLKNRNIPRAYLNKIPKQIIEKYRLLVFDQNISGSYLIACEQPDSPLTRKFLKGLERENKTKFEIYATSKTDLDFIVENYDSNSAFKISSSEEEKSLPKTEATEKKEEKIASEVIKEKITQISKTLFKKNDAPRLTVDSIFKPSERGKTEKFQNTSKADIIKKTDFSLVGKIEKEYLSKLPKEFINKYRVVVFGENEKGELRIATDEPSSELTKKAVEFIKNQHPVEVVIVKKDDIDYALSIYE